MNPHVPDFKFTDLFAIRGVACKAPDCPYLMYAGVRTEESYAALFKSDHAVQYEPGRAPDIEVDWEPSASCSVCEDSGDVKADPDGDGLVCGDCGTRWDMQGESGEKDEEAAE